MNIQYFGACPNDGSDTTPAVRAALDALRGQKDARLVFSPGRYDFYPDRAVEKYLFISNHDECLKHIAFWIEGFDGLEIDGGGAQFVFHGLISPFALQDSGRVRLGNFSIDWARTFHSEALVLATHPAENEAENGVSSVDLQIPAAFPYRIEDQQLIFTGEGSDSYILGNALQFDPVRRETARDVHDNYAIHAWHRALEIGPRQVRLSTRFSSVPAPGNVLALIDGMRFCPAISASDCHSIAIENVSLYHCGGMGFIAQRSRDIQIRKLSVVPAPDSKRLISLSADATHFVNCAGHIEISDCRFENQLDDATNVHGIYARISQRVSDTELELELVHPQQVGVTFAGAGDRLGFIDNQTLETYHGARVQSVTRLNRSYTRLQFAAPLPAEVSAGHGIENHEWQPDVTIRGCTARGNRARGFLISTPGRVLIENNTFHTPGAAILIAGDVNHWFESGAVRDVTIRGNTFNNCLFGVWGRAVIDICPEIEPQFRAGSRYHRGISIENNRFCALDARILRAQCVNGLTISGNIIESSNDYGRGEDTFDPNEPKFSDAELYFVEACQNVLFHNNGGAESSVFEM